MALFDVPGWTVPDTPVSESTNPRKRKRPGKDEDKVQTASINFEKLMKKLDTPTTASQKTPSKKQRKRAKKDEHGVGQSEKRAGAPHTHGKDAERPQQAAKHKEKGGSIQAKRAEPTSRSTPSKKTRNQSQEKQAASQSTQPHDTFPAPEPTGSSPKSKDGLTALQAGMKSSLDGARFRWINELLYKSDSEHAHQMMQEDPKVYEEYHTGFRHQVHSWPNNPVSHYISLLSSYPQKTVIADLGCGDAALARALIPKGMTVLSFDLVSDGVFVVEADTCTRIPLPGSDGTEHKSGTIEGEGGVVDVAVCALSLMGTNWPNCIREAWRVLRSQGELKIAEVASRFTDVDDFVSVVCSFGFRLKSKDDRNSHFTLFEFKKVPMKAMSQKELEKLLSRGVVLKPCEYKRR